MAIENNVQARAAYEKYLKIGKKEKGTLPVLDHILRDADVAGEISLGLVSVPLDKIVGTRTEGRSDSFSPGFYPRMEEGTEFAGKWMNLYRAHLEEGIRDPVKLYEYMNRFYVLEGNKRVSVLKCVGAVSVDAEVTRVMPFRSEDKDVKHYYEFVDFYRLSGMYDLELSGDGDYAKLQRLIGKRPDEKWREEDRRNVKSLYYRFEKIYQTLDGTQNRLPGDAFVTLLELYDYQELLYGDNQSLKEIMKKALSELKLEKTPQLQMEPGEIHEKKGIFTRILPVNAPVLKAAFLHEKTAETSSWTYAHELGRLHLQEVFSEQIETVSYEGATEENIEDMLEQSIADGNQLIFTTAPPLLKGSLHVAMEHPDIKILNCSLNTSHKYIRTYYARMYEAKFLMGAIAGAIAENGRIGYLADYPIYGMTANINAFALGAKMINPRAEIYLEWTTMRGHNPFETFREHGVKCISGQDMIVPKVASRHFGLYLDHGDDPINLAMPVWHWGKFYEQMIRRIMKGEWKADETGDELRGVNYWWGMSADVIDVICSQYLPIGTTRLVNLLKETIRSDTFNPFSGILYSQNGIVQKDENKRLSPEEIVTMDWLAENVVGRIPDTEELVAKAKPLIETQGLKEGNV